MARSPSVNAAADRAALRRTARHAPAHARKPRRQTLPAAARRSWRGWRRSRPFWGALCTVAGGAEIAAVRLTLAVGRPDTIVPIGVLIAAGLVVCGLLLVFDPVQRSLYSTAAILLAIAALATSHLGGYLIGSALGAAGGAIAFAWVPMVSGTAPTRPAHSTGPLTLILGEAEDRPSRARRGNQKGTGRTGAG
jgi:hypothetical protein